MHAMVDQTVLLEFSTFKYKIETGCDWTGVKFSLDGKLMMLTTNGAVVRVVEAFEGKPMFTLSGYQNNKVVLLSHL